MEQYVKGFVKFYDDEKEVIFPLNYDEFRIKLGQMLGLTEDLLKCVNISFVDEEKDNIEIKSQSDYQQFLSLSKKLNGKGQINIQIAQESNIDIKECSKSILSFVEKSNEELPVDNIDNGNNSSNQVINDNNIINNNNNVNQMSNIKNSNQNNNNNQINNSINNNQNNNNQSNYIPSQQNPQISFSAVCKYCQRYPLSQVLYYCKVCDIIFCSFCEKQVGLVHEHPYYKVQNRKQLSCLNLGGRMPNMDKIMNDVGKAMEDAYSSVAGFLGIRTNRNANNNNVNNVNNVNNINNVNNVNNVNNQRVMQPPRQYTLVEQARMRYDLSKVSDKDIEEALKKSGNNIDDAVLFLVPQ